VPTPLLEAAAVALRVHNDKPASPVTATACIHDPAGCRIV